MRLFSCFVAAAACLAGCASAADRHAYQKIGLWYAYQIDLLNPEDKRTIGVKCAVADPKGNCLENPNGDKYKPCRGSGKDGSCIFREFISHISGNKKNAATGNFDGKEEPEDLRQKKVLQWKGGQETDIIIKDQKFIVTKAKGWKTQLVGWTMVKDVATFEDAIPKVAEVVRDTKASLSPEDQARHKDLFDGHEAAYDNVKLARTRDAENYYLKELKPAIDSGDLKGKIILKYSKQGIYDKMFDYEQTVKESEKKFKTGTARADLDGWFQQYYANNPKAVNHKAVIETVDSAAHVAGGSCAPK